MATTAKGAAKRQHLMDAALRILERDGASAVTHRAVATEAGVPLAAATYYFESIDDLMISALRSGTDEQVAMFAHLAAGDIHALAEVFVEWAITTRSLAISQYELMFLAMRRPGLREDAERWYEALENAIEPLGLDPVRAEVAALAIDGLGIRMLWRGEPSTVDATEAALRDILGLQRPGP